MSSTANINKESFSNTSSLIEILEHENHLYYNYNQIPTISENIKMKIN